MRTKKTHLRAKQFYADSQSVLFRAHGRLRRVRHGLTPAPSTSDVFRTSPSYTMFRRSVASAASVPIRQTATNMAPRSTRLLDLRDKNSRSSRSNLNSAWGAFCKLRHADDSRPVDPSELFSIGGMILRDSLLSGDVSANSNEWGRRLEDVVYTLRGRIGVPSLSESFRLECLFVVSQALQGRSEDAAVAIRFLDHFSVEQLKFVSADHHRWALDTFKHVLLSLLRRISAARAIDFFLENYSVLARQLHFERHGKQWEPRLYRYLNVELSAIFRAIDSPTSFVSSKASSWDKNRTSFLGGLMIHAFCADGSAEDALAVYEELGRHSIPVVFFLEHMLVRALAKMERFERANLLYISIRPQSPNLVVSRSYDAVGLYLFARQADAERAEDCFKRLAAGGEVSPEELNLVLLASAKRGDTERVVELFDEFFGKHPERSELQPRKPSRHHYSTVINAYAVRDDIDSMNKWLDRMLADGRTPDRATYNIILKGVAQRDDIKSINSLLDQMRDSGVSPDINSYTTAIKVLARRRDVLGAEALFKRMMREGIALDRRAVTTLMNAHVEAGSWRGVIHIFDYIRTAQPKDIKLGVEVFNTLLKAYVLIGAPFDVVFHTYQRLEKSGMRPTNRTFAILIQSACAAGRMDVASGLYREMENLGQDWSTGVEVTVEVLTIIMAAHLRLGNKMQARAVYDEMQKRGIRPTAHTYASILKSYSEVGTEESMRIVQEFLDTLISVPPEERRWAQPTSGREGGLAFVYAPVINAFVKKLDVESVERIYQEFSEHSKKPTIGILALLMDVYRRKGNIEGVQRVWPQIFDLASERTDGADALLDTSDVEMKFFRSQRRGDLLCLPLSMYIDALSYAGKHIEIAHTWNKLREEGFQFDSHNWNHLVVALVRAGQPVRAFEVVEKVILPYEMQSQHIFRERPEKVDSPLVFSNEEIQREIQDEPFITSIERSHKRRARLLKRLRRHFRSSGSQEPPDLAHELHLMQQISPEWSVWRPHNVTLMLLAQVLERLDAGSLIRPTEAMAVQTDGDDGEETPPETHRNQRPSSEELKEAREMLDKILISYPNTIARIDTWETESTKRRRRP